jgi:hypothetical protein
LHFIEGECIMKKGILIQVIGLVSCVMMIWACLGGNSAVSGEYDPEHIDKVELTGRIFGGVDAFFVENNFAYVCENDTFVILDLADPENPVTTGLINISLWSRSVNLSGNYAYIGHSTGIITILDVSNPEDPFYITEFFKQGGGIYNIYSSGNYVYLVQQYGIEVIDVTDPVSPVEAGSFYFNNKIYDFCVSGSSVYVTDYNGCLHVVDASDPLRMYEIGRYYVPESTIDICVEGDLAFLATEDYGLVILDISDPLSIYATDNYFVSGAALSLDVSSSSSVCLIDNLGYLYVIDFSDPFSLKESGFLNIEGNGSSIQVSGNYAYINDEDQGLRIIDISNNLNLFEAGVFNYENQQNFGGFDVSGDIACRKDKAKRKITILDFSDLLNPKEIGSIESSNDIYAEKVSGNYLYLSGYSFFQIWDISNPAEPQMLSESIGADIFDVDGDYACLVLREELSILNISDPSSVIELGSLSLESGIRDIKISGQYVYLRTSRKFYVINISNPEEPVISVTLDVDSEDFDINGNYAFFAQMTGVAVYDITNPETPQWAGEIASSENIYWNRIRVSEKYAYIADRFLGLDIYNISDITNPWRAGYYLPHGRNYDVWLSGEDVYLRERDSGFYILRSKTNAPSSMLGCLTPYGDIWGAENSGVSPFENPTRRGWLGFSFDPQNNNLPLSGDVNGMGNDDLIQITPYGDAWVSIRNETTYSPPSRWGWLGFKYTENDTSSEYGWYPLSGDADGDGNADLVQVTEYGDAWVSLSTETSYSAPSRWGWPGFKFSRPEPGESGYLPILGDVDGDGDSDLIDVTKYGDAWVALSDGASFQAPSRWGWLGFKYAPLDGWMPLSGDFNADGKTDLLQITPTGDPWVSLSTATSFSAPTRWGWLNFYYNEATGQYPITADVNSDGKTDLLQITPEGESWVSFSKGDSFDSPENWGFQNFKFSREEHWLPFYLGY